MNKSQVTINSYSSDDDGSSSISNGNAKCGSNDISEKSYNLWQFILSRSFILYINDSYQLVFELSSTISAFCFLGPRCFLLRYQEVSFCTSTSTGTKVAECVKAFMIEIPLMEFRAVENLHCGSIICLSSEYYLSLPLTPLQWYLT